MSVRERIRRWRFRQHREAGRALWMYGPFTRPEARRVGRQLKFSPYRVARVLRAYRQAAHG